MLQVRPSQTSTNVREYKPFIDWPEDSSEQTGIDNIFQHEGRHDVNWFSLSIANAQRKSTNTLAKVIIPAGGTLAAYTTETIPDAIRQNWQIMANAELSEQSYLFISHLARKPWGWRGPGSRSLRTGSLANFLSFWSGVKEEAVEPDFVLTPNGNLQAEWYKDNSHFVELEFRPDHQIFFGLFDGKLVLEGQAKAAEVNALLGIKDYRPLKWACGS